MQMNGAKLLSENKQLSQWLHICLRSTNVLIRRMIFIAIFNTVRPLHQCTVSSKPQYFSEV